jgi:hypothetical protein
MINGVTVLAGLLSFLLISVLGALGAEEDCPWYQDSRVSPTIKAHCQCARNPSSNNQLSIQCQEVEGSQLVASLTVNRGKLEPLELLYLNASRVTDANGQVPVRVFRDVKMVSVRTHFLPSSRILCSDIDFACDLSHFQTNLHMLRIVSVFPPFFSVKSTKIP